MSLVIPDFKDHTGRWVRSCTTAEGRRITLAGTAHSEMKARCVPGGSKQRQDPTYAGCEDAFGGFQNFAGWYTKQIGYGRGFQLDKDILVRGNKIYSPDNCVLLPGRLNTLLSKVDASRGDLPVGVTTQGEGYRARLSTDRGQVFIGQYTTAERAFLAYAEAKEAYIKEVADMYQSIIDPRAYAALLAYRVRITD